MLATLRASAARRGGSLSNLLSGNGARLLHRISLFVAGAAIFSAPNFARGQAPPPPPAGEVVTGDVEGIETLTYGPIHEAFAAPTNPDPTPGPVVPNQPPASIDEEPPALKAEGAIWVGGYWEWDDEAKDFIWISGNWRVPPPGMRWVPSYWVEAAGGWQRVPGFWVSADAGELEYREMPPESLEAGPTGPAPADNYFWIPGTWNYYDTGYRWRTGYWSPYQADWIWCPARWVWTPSGCVYTAGFWDRRVPYRGYFFAPIRFRTPLYLNVGFRYRPWCAVPTSNLFTHLWYRPGWNCYYFGNYYGRGGGFIPWYRCGWGDHRRYYDPIGSWCRTHYRRQGIDYTARMDGWHNHFVRNENLRPPRTWRDQRELIAQADIDVRDSQRILGAELGDLARRDTLPIRLTQLDQRERDALAQVNDQLRDLRAQRVKVETDARARIAGRVPLDGNNSARPGNLPGGRAGADAATRARESLKLQLPQLDDRTAARIDAALGASAGASVGARRPARTLPDVADPGPSGARSPLADRTGRADTGRADPGRTTGSARADEVLQGLRDRGLLPDNQPRTTPRAETPDVPGRGDTPRSTPRGETAPRNGPRGDLPELPRTGPRNIPGVDQSDRVPDVDSPRRVPDMSDRIPRTDIPRTTPRIEIPGVTPRTETPRSTPRVEIPRTTPRGDIPSVTPRSTPRIEIPRGDSTPRSTPRIDIPRVNPRMEVPRSTPRIDVPRSTPRVDIPRTSPRIEIPRGNSGASRSSASPSRSSASAAARSAIESARSSAAARGGAGRASRGRDRD